MVVHCVGTVIDQQHLTRSCYGSMQNVLHEWSAWKNVLIWVSSIHTSPVSSLPPFGMCDFGIPEIKGHLYRKWQRDGWLRLAVQAHVTVCYDWAGGQSQGCKCSADRKAHLAWIWHASCFVLCCFFCFLFFFKEIILNVQRKAALLIQVAR